MKKSTQNSLKGFLKPSKQKLIIFAILLLIPLISIYSTSGHVPTTPLQPFITRITVFWLYLILPVIFLASTLFGSVPIGRGVTGLLIVVPFYLYFLACVFAFAIQKLRKK